MFSDRVQHNISLQSVQSADGTFAIGRASGDIVVTSVDVFNTQAVATHATNYVTFKVINLGTDAQGTTVVASASTSQTGGTAMAANVAFPLSVVAAAKAVSSGQTLGFVYDESTTDFANTQAVNVVVNYLQVGAP